MSYLCPGVGTQHSHQRHYCSLLTHLPASTSPFTFLPRTSLHIFVEIGVPRPQTETPTVGGQGPLSPGAGLCPSGSLSSAVLCRLVTLVMGPRRLTPGLCLMLLLRLECTSYHGWWLLLFSLGSQDEPFWVVVTSGNSEMLLH